MRKVLRPIAGAAVWLCLFAYYLLFTDEVIGLGTIAFAILLLVLYVRSWWSERKSQSSYRTEGLKRRGEKQGKESYNPPDLPAVTPEPDDPRYHEIKHRVESYWWRQKPQEVEVLEASGDFDQIVISKARNIWQRERELYARGMDKMQVMEMIEPEMSPPYTEEEIEEEFK